MAANPANALLNYLYSLLESAARLSCLAIGLDPGVGVLHADLRARDSLALDVIEAVRPDVDAVVLDHLLNRTFRTADCRVLAPLTHELAATLPVWEARLAPVVEDVARAFAAGPDSRVRRMPTLLTGDRRSAGRDGQRKATRQPVAWRVRLTKWCQRCGGITAASRDYCDACLPEVTDEQRTAFVSAGRAGLRRQKAEGRDPSHGADAALSRGRKVSGSRRAAMEWERSNGPAPDPEVFRRDVLPHIQGMPAAKLAVLTGLSRPYCSAILRGERVPHPRWWGAMRSPRS